MDDQQLGAFVTVFKALADPARLRILGAIAERPLTGKELSERLGLTAPTVSHHMAKLAAADLIRVTPDAQRRLYALNEGALRDLTRRISTPSVDATAPEADRDDRVETAEGRERAKVLRDFFDGARLKQIPAQRKKRVIVLQHLLTRFDPARDYSEREVNDLLRAAHDDVATLRRELVDYGFMVRDRGIYRIATELPARGSTVAQEVGNEQIWFEQLVAGATARVLHRRDPPSPETPPGPHG